MQQAPRNSAAEISLKLQSITTIVTPNLEAWDFTRFDVRLLPLSG